MCTSSMRMCAYHKFGIFNSVVAVWCWTQDVQRFMLLLNKWMGDESSLCVSKVVYLIVNTFEPRSCIYKMKI